MTILEKKIDKYNCKWIIPSKTAWWEWQTCKCPQRELVRVEIIDVSCFHQGSSGGMINFDCPYFEEKEQK